jgi:hypothetical protein
VSAQHTPGREVSSHGYTDAYGPNVSRVLTQATRVIRGPIPAQVRAELRAAVKAGVLGHLKRDGLKPEVFFHPSHKNGAIERQKREAEYSVGCIEKVVVGGEEKFRNVVDAMLAKAIDGAQGEKQ